MNKAIYLDLMEKAVSAYSEERTRAYIDDVKENLIGEHGFCRLTANTGFLIAHGRLADKKARFCEMMDICCTQIPYAMEKHGHRTGNDFSVKEIVICLLELEKYGIFPEQTTQSWREKLKKIDPYTTYSCIAAVPPERISNWAAFSAASEQMRVYAGLGNEENFIDNQIASQLLSFDENGMFRDPHEPMVYDMVTRLQLAVALHFGYSGSHRRELEEQFVKSADITLLMQSVTGEIPFGGRSNQFLHNDSFYAALCEYYGNYFAKAGDMSRASRFRGAAELAIKDLTKWLSREHISHIKNGYDPDAGIGCEGYGYFDKYMVTLGSWCMLAYIFAEDSVTPAKCPAENGSFVFSTSEHFHKLILTSGGYTAEVELNPFMLYDCGGLGRLQKAGACPVVCMSVPCTVTPKYGLPAPNEYNLSIAPGIRTDGGDCFALTPETKYEVLDCYSDENMVCAALKTVIPDDDGCIHDIFFSIKLDKTGAEISAVSDTQVLLLLPALQTDGLAFSEITQKSPRSLEVSFEGSTCVYTSASDIKPAGYSSHNRNGSYKAFVTEGSKKVTVHIEII